MPTFIDMSALTLKSSASGQEEIQVSESNKINTSQIAALAPSQQLTGFTALTAGKPAITANTTLLAAIQSLYAMVGSGKVKIVSDGADQTGMVCWNGTLASGFVINLDESAIYIRPQWTLASPDSVTDANWIAAVKFGATKTPFAAAGQNPNLGDLPISSNVKFEDSKVGIGSMLRMLTAAANVGRMRIVSGNPLTGASGKPELAFIVNIIQGVNAETDDTFGLQIFHLTNDYIRVIPSSSVDITWTALQSMTDEAVIKRLNSTSGWGGLGVKLPWTGGSVKPIKVEDFTTINEIWPTELTPGTTVPFYAEGEMYSAPSEATNTAYVGQIILNADFATSGMATVVAYGNKAGRMYHAQLDFNGQSIDWFSSPVGTLTLTTFTTLTANAIVSNMKIGEMLGFYSSNGGSTSGPGASPLFGYIQKTSSSQVNIFAYTIDGKKSWLGYNAGSNVTWTPVGGASGGNVIHGEDITEGLEYLIPENVGDVVAFRSTMDSSQVPAEQEGFGFLAKVNGSESMAMMMQNDPAGGGKMKFFMGRVQNDGSGTDWQELTAGGMEALWTPTTATYVSVDTDAGNGKPVNINLTRALKATDRVLITWRKQNTSYSGIDVPGQAIINPNAYDHDVFLELVENFVTPSEYYGLFLDQSATEAGSEILSFSAVSFGGSTYGPQYLITGIYNISGK